MVRDQPSHVTNLLSALRAGDPDAANQLVATVYADLRDIASGLLRGERQGHSLQPSDLVHEAFLRLLPAGALGDSPDRAYFFAAAAQAMRQVLVEHARRRASAKRGGGWQRVPLPLDDVLASFEATHHLDVLALHEALSQLALLNGRHSQIVELRLFGGHTLEDIAAQLRVSLSTVEKDFRQARAFLHARLGGGV
jgi:RNA polymerase sigma factor (TIGR02999 family)